jgi:hypothetical protein
VRVFFVKDVALYPKSSKHRLRGFYCEDKENNFYSPFFFPYNSDFFYLHEKRSEKEGARLFALVDYLVKEILQLVCVYTQAFCHKTSFSRPSLVKSSSSFSHAEFFTVNSCSPKKMELAPQKNDQACSSSDTCSLPADRRMYE